MSESQENRIGLWVARKHLHAVQASPGLRPISANFRMLFFETPAKSSSWAERLTEVGESQENRVGLWVACKHLHAVQASPGLRPISANFRVLFFETPAKSSS